MDSVTVNYLWRQQFCWAMSVTYETLFSINGTLIGQGKIATHVGQFYTSVLLCYVLLYVSFCLSCNSLLSYQKITKSNKVNIGYNFYAFTIFRQLNPIVRPQYSTCQSFQILDYATFMLYVLLQNNFPRAEYEYFQCQTMTFITIIWLLLSSFG